MDGYREEKDIKKEQGKYEGRKGEWGELEG